MNAKNKSSIYVLVGAPGSGKSTWMAKYLIDNEAMIVSTDTELERIAVEKGISYGQAFKESYGSAEKAAKRKFSEAIEANQNVIWDQTNMSSKKRRKILSQVPNRYNKVAVVFQLDRDVLNERLAIRAKETGKFIPQSVVDDMLRVFEMPSTDEGFNEVIKI